MMKSRYRHFLLPILIFLIAMLLRLYHLPERFIFTADEEYQATYAWTIVQDFHPIWIGVSSGDTGFYLGPYFTYFTAFWLSISQGDPVITAYVAAILGSVTCVLLYYLGKLVGGNMVGGVSALIYSFSPLIVYHDQRYWNPSPSALLSITLLLAINKLKDSDWWLSVVAFCIGAFWHIHLSLVPLIIVAIYAVWQHRNSITWKIWFVSICVFAVMITPLVIFDYYHSWSNILTPIRLLSRETTQGNQIIEHVRSLGETLTRTIYLSPGKTPAVEIRPEHQSTSRTVPDIFPIVLALLGLLLPIGNKYLTFSLLLMAFSYVLYPGSVTGYYALGLLPFYLIALAKLLTRLSWGYLILFIFAILSLRTLTATNENFGLTAKHNLINQVTQFVGKDTFSLSEEGTSHKYGGWRYLFSVYGQKPVTSSTDTSLAWLYPDEVGGQSKYFVSVGATKEFVPTVDSLAVYQSGGYTAVITYAK